jgi:putative transposase
LNDFVKKEPCPKRKSLPHFPGIERHNQAIIHFVTVCTKNRQTLLASDLAHRILLEAWSNADSFLVGRYVLMPDHIHLFCAPARPLPGYLEAWVKYWKSLVTQRLPIATKGQFWQRDFWDTQLRQSESYAAQWDYVWLNPVRHGLVKNPDDWPYQGEVHQLEWHD